MRLSCRLTTVLMAAFLLGSTAWALIAVKLPVSKIYSGSRNVIVGTVKKVNLENGGVEVTAKALKGSVSGDTLRFKIENLPAVLAALKEGSPYVLLTGRSPENFALHIADTWLLPQPTQNPALFAVQSEKDLRQSYPGTTSALLRIIESAGDKYTMLDEITEEAGKAMFKGEIKDFGPAPAGTTAVFAVRPKGAATSTLVFETPAGPKYFSVTADGMKPAAAVEDGRPRPVAANAINVFGNFGEDDKQYAIVIKDGNILRQGLEGAAEPADFLRLTGERIATYSKGDPKWLGSATAAALDINGDKRMDVLVNTSTGPVLLINRGYGAFFIDADIHKVLKTKDGAPLLTDKTPWTAIDVDGDGQDDLLIVSATGNVTVVLNAKPEKK